MVDKWSPGQLGSMRISDTGNMVHEDDYDAIEARMAEAERKLARIVAARDALSPRYRVPADLDIAINAARATDSADEVRNGE